MRLLAAFLAAFLAALAWTCFAPPTIAAIGTPVSVGTYTDSANNAARYVSTTADCPPSDLLILSVAGAVFSAPAGSDSSSNTYSTTSLLSWDAGARYMLLIYSPITTDLPAPCTVTGTISTTTLTISAIGTCGSGSTTNPHALVVGDVISGTSVTAQSNITGVTTAWNGATGVYTLGQSSTVSVGETITVSSAVKVTDTGNTQMAISTACVSGLATSGPLDITGTGVTGTSTSGVAISPAATTGTLNQAAELVIGFTGILPTISAYTSNSPFTNMTAATAGGYATPGWGYDIVSVTTSVSYAPSWTTAKGYGANVYTFKGFVPSVARNGPLLGVYP